MNWTIRQLDGDDVVAYRALRHEALTNHPEAYASSPEGLAQRSDDDLRQMLGEMAFFGVFDKELAGMAAVGRSEGERERHRGWLYQVYVAPRLRGSGAAAALIERVAAHASTEMLQLHLSVATHNQPAIRLYQKAGFVIYGTDPRFLHVNGRYVDEHLMVRFFDEAPGKSEP